MGKYNTLFKINKILTNLVGKWLSLLRIPAYLKLRNVIKFNKNLKAKRSSDKCYICGLGPSLKDIDISKLDADIIAVNRFNMVGADNNVTPTYYCIIDNSFFEGKDKNDFYNAVDKYPNTAFVLNGKYYTQIQKKFGYKDNFFYACFWKGIFTQKNKIDFRKILPVFINVVGAAIALAMFVGYKEIILLGCDFNSFASPKAVHCYDEVNQDRKWTMAFELFSYSFAADMHYELQKYAKINNIRIINSSKGSLLDAYEKDLAIIKPFLHL